MFNDSIGITEAIAIAPNEIDVGALMTALRTHPTNMVSSYQIS